MLCATGLRDVDMYVVLFGLCCLVNYSTGKGEKGTNVGKGGLSQPILLRKELDSFLCLYTGTWLISRQATDTSEIDRKVLLCYTQFIQLRTYPAISSNRFVLKPLLFIDILFSPGCILHTFLLYILFCIHSHRCKDDTQLHLSTKPDLLLPTGNQILDRIKC